MNKLLLILLTLLPLSASAQREIQFYEPDFDSAYAYHINVYRKFVEIPHYNEFYSQWAKENQVSKITKTTVDSSRKPLRIETERYDTNGYLQESIDHNGVRRTYRYSMFKGNIKDVIAEVVIEWTDNSGPQKWLVYFNEDKTATSLINWSVQKDENKNTRSYRYASRFGKRKLVTSTLINMQDGSSSSIDLVYDTMKTKEYLYYPNGYDGISKELGKDDPATLLESSPHRHEYISLKETPEDTLFNLIRSIDVHHYYTKGDDIYNATEMSSPTNNGFIRLDPHTRCGDGQISKVSGHQSFLSYQWDRNEHLKLMSNISSTISGLRPIIFYSTYDMEKKKALGLLKSRFTFLKQKDGRLTEFIWDDTYSKTRTIYTYE